MIKRLFFQRVFLLTLLIFTSCQYKENLDGTWAAIEMYYGPDLIPKNESWARIAPSLEIRGSNIFIDFHGDANNLSGKIRYRSSGEQESVSITGLKDDRLNGTYKLSLELSRGTEKSDRKEFELILQSDSVFIRAVRSQVKLL